MEMAGDKPQCDRRQAYPSWTEIVGRKRTMIPRTDADLGVDGVKARDDLRSHSTCDHHKFVSWQVEIDVLEVVGSCTANLDLAHGNDGSLRGWKGRRMATAGNIAVPPPESNNVVRPKRASHDGSLCTACSDLFARRIHRD